MKNKKIRMKNYKEITVLFSLIVIIFSILTLMNHVGLILCELNNYIYALFFINLLLSILGAIYLYKKHVGVGFLWWRFIISLTYMFYSCLVGYYLTQYYFKKGVFFFDISMILVMFVSVLVIINIYKLIQKKDMVMNSGKYTYGHDIFFNLSKAYYGGFEAKVEVNKNIGRKLPLFIIIGLMLMSVLNSNFPITEQIFWVFSQFVFFMMSLMLYLISLNDLIFIYAVLPCWHRKKHS